MPAPSGSGTRLFLCGRPACATGNGAIPSSGERDRPPACLRRHEPAGPPSRLRSE
ncbi:hypothetical protein [Azospirillum argentinense]